MASLMKAHASGTYFHVAAGRAQIRSSIGLAWERDAHLHLKRARSSELFLGGAPATTARG